MELNTVSSIDKKQRFADNPTINKVDKEFKVSGLYKIELVKAAIKLSGFAQILFILAVEQLIDNTEGVVVLDGDRLCEQYKKTEKTFYNAINNMVENDILLLSDRKNMYWINWTFIEQCL